MYVCVYRGMCAQSHRVMCVQSHVRIKSCVCMYVCVRVHRIISAHDCNVHRSHGVSFHWYGVISTQCTPQSRCVCSHGVYACTHYPVHTCLHIHSVHTLPCTHMRVMCVSVQKARCIQARCICMHITLYTPCIYTVPDSHVCTG